MLLASTLVPAVIMLFFLEILLFRNFNWQGLKYLIVFGVGGACIYSGEMHMVIIGMYILAIGSLWIFAIYRIRRRD